jgi:hypothetical protein
MAAGAGRPGELKTIPSFKGRVSNQDQIWPVAVNEAITRAKEEAQELKGERKEE